MLFAFINVAKANVSFFFFTNGHDLAYFIRIEESLTTRLKLGDKEVLMLIVSLIVSPLSRSMLLLQDLGLMLLQRPVKPPHLL